MTQVISVSADDPCQLEPTSQPVWYGSPSRVKTCFDAIPFFDPIRKTTMEIMERVMALYSFSDIVQAGLSPYLLNVDWPGMLNHVNSTTYGNDFEFHNALGAGMATLLDAHAIYYVPSGYRAFATIRPFSLTSSLVNGTQQYFAAPSRISSDVYSALCGCETDLSVFYGRRILYIDTVPVDDFLVSMAAHAGFYLDPGAQMNHLLSSSSAFAFQSTAFIALPSDTINIVFEGDLVGYNFNNYMTTSRLINSTQQIIDLNIPPVKRSDPLSSFENSFHADEEAVLNLIKGQIARKKLTAEQMAVAEQNAAKLETSIRVFGAANENQAERRRSKSYAPSLRFQQLMDAWGTFLSFENGVPEWIQGQQTIQQENLEKKEEQVFGVTSAVASIVEGNMDHLVSYKETTALSYWSYAETSVLRLKSFFPPSETEMDAFLDLVNTAAHSRGSNGLSKNLILDVSGNGGGYVCLSYFMLSYLVRPWNKASLTGNDILFSPYDIRQSKYTDDIFEHGYWGSATEEISEATRQPLGPSFYTNRVQRQYGLHSSNYTQKFLWNLCDADNYKLSKKSLVFDKILVITDGRCGSACSYFLTKLRLSDKVRVLGYGSHWGKPMDTSAFSGGNVHSWADWISELREHMPSLNWLTKLPTTAVTTFNFREMYNPGEDVPRQFIRMEADWMLPFWDPLRGSTDLSSSSQKQALATLYASAIPLFEHIPSGLLGTNTSAPLIIALVVIGLLVATTVIIGVTVAIITNRRNRISPDYGEISSAEA
jgi:hypothetical protein